MLENYMLKSTEFESKSPLFEVILTYILYTPDGKEMFFDFFVNQAFVKLILQES